jgi:hypothetical protein
MIVTIEASVSGSNRGLLVQFLDFAIEYLEGGTERAWPVILLGEQRRPIGPKDTQIKFGVEEGDLETVIGRGIAVGLRHTVDQPLESKAAEVIRHLRGGIRATPEGFHLRAEVAIVKAARQMSKADDALQERRAIFTDILQFRARVLVYSSPRTSTGGGANRECRVVRSAQVTVHAARPRHVPR